jgi:type VI secretion system secreted protein VgrG
VVSTDFDFKRPRTSLLAQRLEPDDKVSAGYEDFDYPGEYVQSDEGSKEVRVRIEAHHADRELAEGAGNAAGIAVGALFKLEKFPRADQNKEYLVVRANYQIQVNADESGIRQAASAFLCQFAAIDAGRPFRTVRSTRKPVVEGPQTAIVVGPAGEEIFTDEYARVKVKFHWDRLSTGDENSSCWVRVAQLWAGVNFGGIHIPRIGQEVIVDFLEGDPDRPIITGRVYNFENQPPYDLPANQTQSGIKSHSTKGATIKNYNELRFEDRLGSEQVYMQAEKDLAVLVKNDEQRDVGASRTSNIGTDDTLDVGQNRSATIGLEDMESVGANQTVTIGANQTVVVTATRSLTSATESVITGNRTKTVTESETTTIGTDRTETVGGSESITIGGNQILTINAKRSQSVDKDETISVAGARQQTINNNDQLQVGKRLLITAGDEIVLQSGEGSLTIKKNGDIVLKGNNIQVDGDGKVNIKASSDVVVKGNKIGNN